MQIFKIILYAWVLIGLGVFIIETIANFKEPGKEKSILYRTGEFILYILIGAGLLIYAMIRATKIKMKEKKEASLTDKEKEL